MLVTPLVLKEWMESGGVSIFDCRFSLADANQGVRQYAAGHIPGAVYLNLERDLSRPVSKFTGRHPLPNPLAFAMRLSKFGASDDTPAVFYDGGDGMAARGWWLLRYIGHQKVYLLDGGLRAWLDEGLPVTQEIPAPRTQSLSVHLQSDMVATEEDVEQVVAGTQAGILLDARAASRYRGEEEPIDAKAGHIPGAKNAPWTEGVDETGRWLSPREQLRRFRQVSGEPALVIHYCGSGVTACNNYFAMTLAGLPESRLYPGSWSGWISKEGHLVEKGKG